MSCFFKTQLEQQLFDWISKTVDFDENGIVFEGLDLSEETKEWFAEASFQIDAIKAGILMSVVCGKTALSDHFEQPYIDTQTGKDRA